MGIRYLRDFVATRYNENMKAVYKGIVLADSEDTVFLEGNHYFPFESVGREYLKKSNTQYTCPWKGEAQYYNITLPEVSVEDGAWGYPEPNEAAHDIAGRIAFDKDKIEIKEEG